MDLFFIIPISQWSSLTRVFVCFVGRTIPNEMALDDDDVEVFLLPACKRGMTSVYKPYSDM